MPKEIYEKFIQHPHVKVQSYYDTIFSIAESLKSIDKSLQKIAGEKVIKTNEPRKKSYAEIYFAKDDSTGKWEEK